MSKQLFGQPVPELPVSDVERAQLYYRDKFGFTIAWIEPDKSIGAVARDKTTIFLRRCHPPFEPSIHWVYALDLDGAYAEMQSVGTNITDPLERKPWGLRQFTVRDIDGNIFYFHNDAPDPM